MDGQLQAQVSLEAVHKKSNENKRTQNMDRDRSYQRSQECGGTPL